MSQFVADSPAGLSVKAWVEQAAFAATDGREVTGNMLVTLARIGCTQLVKAFEGICLEDASCREYDATIEVEVGLGWCK
ncbi:hypothetical protein PS3A_39880 [Pseudomonas sp. 3A(2025)]